MDCIYLELGVLWCSWEWNYITNVAHTRNKLNHSFKAQTESSVWHRSKAAGALVNLRLCLAGPSNDLGVTAPLEVEHPLISPTMLIIPNQRPLRVR